MFLIFDLLGDYETLVKPPPQAGEVPPAGGGGSGI